MAERSILLSIIALGFFHICLAFDQSPLQDICVADPTSSVRINGLPCKDPSTVEADDFFFRGLHIPGNTTNPIGAAVTSVTAAQVPGLNTLGLSVARLDFEPNGILPPHYHPRATEILIVLEGSMEVGFVTSNPGYRHLSKVLEKGDVFAVPVGLLHYQRSVGSKKTVVIAAVNSQNPGIIAVPTGVFGAKPAISSEYLARAFGLDEKIVEELQDRFTT